MVARHGNDILVVTDLEKVSYDDAVDRADSHSQAGVSTSGNNRPFCFSGVHDWWETSPQHLRTLSSHSPIEIWPVAVGLASSQSEIQQYTCMLKIVTGLPWENFQFLIFCVVVSRSSLPSARYLIMRSWFCKLVEEYRMQSLYGFRAAVLNYNYPKIDSSKKVSVTLGMLCSVQ